MASNALVQQTITDYLADHDSEHPETTLDPYHPNNTSYYQQHNMLKRLIVAQSSKMKALHVKVAKGVMKAIKNKDIALELNLEPTTISNIKHRDDVKELINLLYHLQALHEGPSIESRKRLLFEITIDNKEAEPKTSIAAIQEMNRMDGVGREKLDTAINITINNDTLPRGALDT
jgi:hypothetical protein